MMGQRFLLLFIIIIHLTLTNGTIFDCKEDSLRVNETSGTLKITRAFDKCGFKTQDDSPVFAIRTSNLGLDSGESIEFLVMGQPSVIFEPPFKSGWLVVGVKEPEILFHLKRKDSSSIMLLDFLQLPAGQSMLDIMIDGDVEESFFITPSSMKSVNLDIKKTVPDYVHVEIDSKQHWLSTTSSLKVPINFEGDNRVSIKTSIALASCSNNYLDTDPAKLDHAIVGPDLSKLNSTREFKCVNLFRNNIKDRAQAHYDVDFKDFVGLSNNLDELHIDDLEIKKPQDAYYTKRVWTSSGNNLAVILKSPKAQKSEIQFKLSVLGRQYGGVISTSGKITLPKGQDKLRLVLKPSVNNYATVILPPKLQNVEIMVSTNYINVAKYSSGNTIPPVLALDQPNLDMVLDISGKNLEQIALEFKPEAINCNRIIKTGGDVATIDSSQHDKCVWAITRPSNIKFTTLNLLNGCLSIYSQQEKPIFEKCKFDSTTMIPTFALAEGYIMITNSSAPQEAAITGAILGSEFIIADTEDLVIQSSNYPDYPWSSISQTYKMIAPKTDLLISVIDNDIRKGEKLMYLTTELTKNNDDIIHNSNKELTVAIQRSSATADFDQHRGFKIVGKRFEEILIANMSANQIQSTGNTSSSLLKISAPPEKDAAHRLSYKITLQNGTDYELSLHDARSIQNHEIKSLTGETTSDTLLVNYFSKKVGMKLPKITVEYKILACNTSIGDFSCDNFTRCVPKDLLCQAPRQFYCNDGSDVKVLCNGSTPVPPPKIIEQGVGGVTVFILCMIMLILGAVGALYGPDLFKNLESRFRSGQYTTFSSVE